MTPPSTPTTPTGAATFTPPTGTVSFADGSLTATVTVDPSPTHSRARRDGDPDGDRRRGLHRRRPGFSDGDNHQRRHGRVRSSLRYRPPRTVRGTSVYTFTRNGVTTGALTVNFSIGGRPPSAPTTRRPVQQRSPRPRARWTSAGSSTATVTVDPTADNTVEPDETVILTVTPGTGYNVGAPSVATGTITNDDSPSQAVAPSTVDEDGVPTSSTPSPAPAVPPPR